MNNCPARGVQEWIIAPGGWFKMDNCPARVVQKWIIAP